MDSRLGKVLGFLWEGLSELFWPTRCAVCDLPDHLLCEGCLAALPRIDQKWACPFCGAPWGWLTCTECDPCLPCGGMPFERARCALEYRDGAKRLVRVYKDGGERRLAEVIAGLMVSSLPDGWGEWADAIVPIPASDRALSRRGFDHMELVVRSVSGLTGLPVALALNRPRALDQRGLGRRLRAANVRGMFSVADVGLVCGRNILLVDDVLTTGATLCDAARALLAAHACQIRVLTLARVW